MTVLTADIAVRPRRSFQEVWVISLGHALTHWYPATFYLLLPLIGKELGLSYSEIGSVLTCQYLAGAIANIPGGIFVDTVGRRGLLLANRFPERKGLVMSIHGMGGNVGDAVAPLVVGALLGILSWRSVVVINVVPGVLIAVFALIYLGRRQNGDAVANMAPAISATERLRMFGALLKNRALITLAAGSAFRTMTQGALLTFLPLYLAREMGYPLFWIGACMFALQAGGFVAAPIAGHLSDRIGRRQIILSSMTMSAVVIFLMLFAGGTGWFVTFVSVLGFFLFAVRAVLQAWLLDATPPAMGGSAIGLLFASQAFGQAVGPLAAGIVADHYGLMGAFYFLAATIVIANFLVFLTPAGLMKRD